MTTVMLLSLWQPWASAIFVPGIKPIETRHWSTHYRGLVAIHAAKKTNGELVRFYNEKRNRRENAGAFFKAGLNSYSQLPLGEIVGLVDLVDCVATACDNPLGLGETERATINKARFSPFCTPGMWPVVETWGDFSPNRFGWCFKNIRRLIAPIQFKGRQGLMPLSQDDTLFVLNRPSEVVTT